MLWQKPAFGGHHDQLIAEPENVMTAQCLSVEWNVSHRYEICQNQVCVFKCVCVWVGVAVNPFWNAKDAKRLGRKTIACSAHRYAAALSFLSPDALSSAHLVVIDHLFAQPVLAPTLEELIYVLSLRSESHLYSNWNTARGAISYTIFVAFKWESD